MTKTCAVVVGLIAMLLMTTGCQETSGKSSPPRTEKREYDCRRDSKDKICEVPWKDKVVLYCYKGKVPRVVRFREEC